MRKDLSMSTESRVKKLETDMQKVIDKKMKEFQTKMSSITDQTKALKGAANAWYPPQCFDLLTNGHCNFLLLGTGRS